MTDQSTSDSNIKFKGLVPAHKALELVLEDATPIGVETIALIECNGRVLAEDQKALRTQPPFAASAMDGYAVRQSDIVTIPTTLNIIGEAAAGHVFNGKLKSGEAVRIFTGAAVPNGADTIIIQENTKAIGDHVEILNGSPKNKFIREAGLDFKQGETLLHKGETLNPQSLSLAASMNHPTLPVYTKPRVCVLATGDELVLPGDELLDGQIIASNTFGIQAIAKSAGANVIDAGIAIDTIEDLTSRIQSEIDQGVDLIVTSGGASVGDHDLVKPVLESFGFVFSFVKIAMRPGKPVIFGRCVIDGKERRFLGLAGNPVSSLVSSHIFLKPLIQLLGGYPAQTIQPSPAVLTAPLPANDERRDYLRGTATRHSDGTIQVKAFERQDSSMLATLNKADCLIIREIDAPPANAGDNVEVIYLKTV